MKITVINMNGLTLFFLFFGAAADKKVEKPVNKTPIMSQYFISATNRLNGFIVASVFQESVLSRATSHVTQLY